jgi:hypothetical protein
VGNFNYSDLKNLENGLKGDKGSYQKVKVYPLSPRVFVCWRLLIIREGYRGLLYGVLLR